MNRIGVISDTHGSVRAWEKAMEILEDPDLIIHCGDVLYHGPLNPIPYDYNTLSLPELINNSAVPVLIAKGNCDAEVDQQVIKWPIMAPYVHLWWHGRHILASHGTHFSNLREQMALFKPDLVITGHTHVASLVREGSIMYLNPGSASLPKGRDPASIAIVSTSQITIQTLDGVLLHRQDW